MGYDSKFREFKIQVVYFVTLYEKNRAATKTYRLWKKRINSTKKIQNVVI